MPTLSAIARPESSPSNNDANDLDNTAAADNLPPVDPVEDILSDSNDDDGIPAIPPFQIDLHDPSNENDTPQNNPESDAASNDAHPEGSRSDDDENDVVDNKSSDSENDGSDNNDNDNENVNEKVAVDSNADSDYKDDNGDDVEDDDDDNFDGEDDDGECVIPNLVKPGRWGKRSKWWSQFMLVNPENHNFEEKWAVCNLCKKKICVTSSLRLHIKSYHAEECSELIKEFNQHVLNGTTAEFVLESDNGNDDDDVAAKGIDLDSNSGGGDEERPTLIKTPRTWTSKWWQHFKIFDPERHPDKTNLVVCNLCKVQVAARAGSCMTHMQTYHAEQCTEVSKTHDMRVLAGKARRRKIEKIENPTLVEQEVHYFRKYARFWVHFKRYCSIDHPEMENFARCNLCSKDINLRRNGLEVYTHLLNWHNPEFRELKDAKDVEEVMQIKKGDDSQNKRRGGTRGKTPQGRQKNDAEASSTGNGDDHIISDADDAESGSDNNNEDCPIRGLIKPDKTKVSKAWKYFKNYDLGMFPDRAGLAVCNLCEATVKSTNTAHMLQHLKACHGERCIKLFRQLDMEQFDARNIGYGDFEIIKNPTLVKPEEKPFTKYGKYLKHFMMYCGVAHPTKKKVARCKLCSRDIRHNKNGLLLYQHISTWHRKEYLELNNGTMNVGGTSPRVFRRKTTRNSNIGTNEETAGNQTGKDNQDNGWFESWEKTRSALNQVRKELKEESDEETREDFKADIKRLRKRKAEYEVLLGMND